LNPIGAVLFSASSTAAAGGTNWTNETSISVTNVVYVEITPTADGQTYKFTNPTSGQMVMATNTTTYNLFIDLTDGSGTSTQYILGYAGATFRYNGTRWRVVST
jgi:gentisate 1,2-dioxygenase